MSTINTDMKKVLLFVAPFAIALGVAPLALADTTINPCASNDFLVLCDASLSGGFGGILTAVFVIAILLALAWLIYGGIRWILSQGDKGKVDSARQHIIAALIGLIIVFLAYFLINIVTQLFFHKNISQITNIPTINLEGDCTSTDACVSGQLCGDTAGCACGTVNADGTGGTKTCANGQYCSIAPNSPQGTCPTVQPTLP